jgi:ArsR family transcriptional regulator
MDPRKRSLYRARAKVVKAMAHPTRLLIVDELAKRQRCVNELTSLVGDDISTVSKHLSVLKRVGILESEKRGMEVHYRLRTKCILQFFTCVEGVLGAGKPRGCR